ncbi:MAG: NAD(P)-dependent oxidoreductase [Acetobacteraceae bacterium]|nr:NAD(P)-dependent oxidoreductase [Acetobacteraceae bacterium]
MGGNQIRLGLIGYGEIGSTLGRGLRGAGLTNVSAYDKYAFDGPYAALIQGRAKEVGVTLVRSPEELAASCDLILGVTPGSSSLASADAFAGCLGPQHVFVDVASATPKMKQSVAARLAATGAVLGDASILGSPKDGHGLSILSSGPAAARFRDAMVPWGMTIEAVPGEIGAASGIKIIRSVLMKGMEAVVLECLLGARAYGIEEMIIASASRSLNKPFIDTMNNLLTTDVIHARRRSEEADMSADALADAGIEPLVTRGTAARLRWVAELGMKEHFEGVVPKHYSDALAGIEAKMKAAASE